MTREEFKVWRHERELLQRELADLLGVAEMTVIRWEAGTRKFPPFLHLALQALDVTFPNMARKEVKIDGLYRKKARKMGN